VFIATVLATVLCAVVPHAGALTIVRDFTGGTPPPDAIGGGDLQGVFNAAADHWERVVLDPHVLTLRFGWAAVGGGIHFLTAQGGPLNRETAGTILFNNDGVPGHFKWYLDPSPHSNEEYRSYRESSLDLGGGPVNVERVYADAAGDAAATTHVDLLSAAVHEIGHALGVSMDNTTFLAESPDGDIDVVAPHPFQHTTIPLAFNNEGVTSHFSPSLSARPVMIGQTAGERNIASALDSTAIAQLSAFYNLNFDPHRAVVTVTTAGSGSGAVTSAPAGIDCGAICQAPFTSGIEVTLTAVPASGSAFAGWTGDADCADGVIAVTTSRACTAAFNDVVGAFVLLVTKQGAGDGTITSLPVGIHCGADCVEPYALGTMVRLIAASESDSVFTGWSGACGGTDVCEVTLNAATTVTATFSLAGSPSRLPGDVDRSGRVDGIDLGRLGAAFGSRAGDAPWNPDVDLNRDGVVDGADLAVFRANFGRSR
jgi:hypothetical protein